MKTWTKYVWLVTLLIQSIFETYAFDFEVDGIAYNITSFSDLTCEVVRNKIEYHGKIVIPETVVYNQKELTVTSISEDCFRGCEELTSVSLSNYITRLANNTFLGCTNLVEIKLPDSLKVIDGMAGFNNGCFNSCTSLKEIILPNGLERLGSGAFQYCESLASVNLPETLISVGVNCFKQCSSLKSVKIATTQLTNLPDEMFAWCQSLESINIPEGIQTFGDNCFIGCFSLSELTLPSSLQEVGFNCFAAMPITHIDLSHLRYISGGMFCSCDKLETLTIPENIEAVGLASRDLDAFWNNTLEYATFGGVPLKSLSIEGESSDELIVGIPPEENSSYFSQWSDKLSGWKDIHGEEISEEDIRFTWCHELEHLKVQRTISGVLLECPNLRTLNIEMQKPNLSKIVYGGIYKLDQLELLEISSLTPPARSSSGSFSSNQYINLKVVVPDEAIDEYRNSEPWKNFWNLTTKSEYESGVESVSINPASINISVTNGTIMIRNRPSYLKVDVYTPEGVFVKRTYEDSIGNLPAGMYIVQIGGDSFKVLI